ncbi:MAG: hypothetical protein J5855_03735 [Mailhella sp.]|nr:hypothetical protein [Mailhella sp.]
MSSRASFLFAAVLAAGLIGLNSSGRASLPDVSAEDAGIMRIRIAQDTQHEMADAIFNHGAHLANVKKDGGDCAKCHALPDGSFGEAFPAIIKESADIDGMKDAWHEFCFDCHAKSSEAPGKASCRSCHDAEAAAPSHLKVTFGRSLHARHVASERIEKVMPSDPSVAENDVKNCGACHTVMKDGKSVYVQNTEDASTFYGTAISDPMALSAAAHQKCVACHAETMKSEGGSDLKLPVECASCHSTEGQSVFPADAAEAPRLFRGQSNTIQLAKKAQRDVRGYALDPAKAIKTVTFNHLEHEKIAECSDCHGMTIRTMEQIAADDDKSASFAAAHDHLDGSSCVGCHAATAKADPGCGGCHRDLRPAGESSCAVCHGETSASGAKAAFTQIAPEDVPETVVIGSLSKDYEPVRLPHRKIYASLLNGTQDKTLAGAFHTQSICLSCHHNTVGDGIGNPPTCSTCHSAEVALAKAGDAPSLKAAYHQMCLDCHKAMAVKPEASDCAGCHVAALKKTSK